jgi:hypothetical protein
VHERGGEGEHAEEALLLLAEEAVVSFGRYSSATIVVWRFMSNLSDSPFAPSPKERRVFA